MTVKTLRRTEVERSASTQLEAWLERREGRKLFVAARGVDQQGGLVVESQALFLVVGLEHFVRGAAS